MRITYYAIAEQSDRKIGQLLVIRDPPGFHMFSYS